MRVAPGLVQAQKGTLIRSRSVAVKTARTVPGVGEQYSYCGIRSSPVTKELHNAHYVRFLETDRGITVSFLGFEFQRIKPSSADLMSDVCYAAKEYVMKNGLKRNGKNGDHILGWEILGAPRPEVRSYLQLA